MIVETVTHCYRYPSVLRYQLSSLILWPPERLDVVATVFFSEEDDDTVRVLKWFEGQTKSSKVYWNWKPLSTLQLCRRSIGRNLAALETKADWTWFTDADYWFTNECWNSLATMEPVASDLIYPRKVWVHRSHAAGDACIRQAAGVDRLMIAEIADFQSEKVRRAIGGVQIVRGDWCRAHGYLPQLRRAQRPAKTPVFTRCIQDVTFRREYKKSGSMPPLAISLPGVYRIRHSEAGRHVPGLTL